MKRNSSREGPVGITRLLHSLGPFERGLLVALGALVAWLFLDCFHVAVGLDRGGLRTSVGRLAWGADPSYWTWLLAISGPALLWLRRRFRPETTGGTAYLLQRLRTFACLVAVLVCLRFLSLWNPIGVLFPYLGLLWYPWLGWSLGVFSVLYLNIPELESTPPRGIGCALSNRSICWLLFVLAALVYGFYTLYFCQVNMLHGDEGQYLHITQSLLYDGDLDLANNLRPEDVREFHGVSTARIQESPVSPPGKVYSLRPVGLAVLLLPSYWAGLAWWSNPRLGCALFMALTASACVPLAFLWLVRIGTARFIALIVTGVMAATAPFVMYHNQLFPGIPALLVSLVVLALLSHWQMRGGCYRSLGRWEPEVLGLLALILGATLFLHPRYLPLALLGGGLVLLQAWHSDRRSASLAAVGLGVAICAYTLVSLNYAYSGDWLGHFRPGNAWREDALEIGTWLVSLPGQWLHKGFGIASSSPVFLLAPIGWVLLALRRDRLLLVVVGLYVATAAVNGLHPVWTFGFCFPARFLLGAMPALLLGLAQALRFAANRPVLLFVGLGALGISLETVASSFAVPELAYEGGNLLARGVNQYYPWQIHYLPDDQAAVPLADVCFWMLLLSAPVVLSRLDQRRWRWSLAAAVALLPAAWGQSDALSSRLSSSLAPYTLGIDSRGAPESRQMTQYTIPFRRLRNRMPDGRAWADENEHEPGYIGWGALPFLMPGMCVVELEDLESTHPEGMVPGHAIVSVKRGLGIVTECELRISQPLVARENQAAKLGFVVDQQLLGRLHIEFTGRGRFAVAVPRLSVYPFVTVEEADPATPLEGLTDPDPDDGVVAAVGRLSLGAGHYRARFNLEGSVWPSLFERKPPPVTLAAYAGLDRIVDGERLEQLARLWSVQDRAPFGTVLQPKGFIRPQVERVAAPWWMAMPILGDRAYELDFILPEAGDVWLLLKYAGPHEIRVAGATIRALNLRQ